MKFLIKFAKDQSHLYFFAFTLIIVTNLLEVALARVSGLAVAKAAVDGEFARNLALVMAGLALMVLIFKWLSRNTTFFAARRLEAALRRRVFQGTLDLSQEDLDKHRSGDLVSRIINDVSDIRMVWGSGFLQINNTFIAYVTTLGAMFLLSPLLAVAALLPFIPFVLIGRKLARVTYLRSRAVQSSLGKLSSMIEETVSGIEVLKSYRSEKWQEKRFEDENNSQYDAEKAAIIPETLLVGTMYTIVWVGILAVLLAAAWMISTGRATVAASTADIATFLFLFVRLVWPSVALGWITNVIQRGLAAAERIRPFVNLRTAVETPENAAPERRGGALVFNDVSYRYPTREYPATESLTIDIPAGEWLAVVGPTASGKTTFGRLASGIRIAQRGEVLVDGVPIGKLAEEERAKRTHLVTQTPVLFSLSIEENLRLAETDTRFTDEEIWSALEDAAFAGEVRDFSSGLETRVGEGGLLLSGGQRQRLALARGFLADSDVLILDDIVSAVDVDTELKLVEGLRRRRNGRTTILITHRFIPLTEFHRVMVLKEGVVESIGTLEETLAGSSWFRRAFDAERLVLESKS